MANAVKIPATHWPTQDRPKTPATMIYQENDDVNIMINGHHLLSLEKCEMVFNPAHGLQIIELVNNRTIATMETGNGEIGWNVKITGIELTPKND